MRQTSFTIQDSPNFVHHRSPWIKPHSHLGWICWFNVPCPEVISNSLIVLCSCYRSAMSNLWLTTTYNATFKTEGVGTIVRDQRTWRRFLNCLGKNFDCQNAWLHKSWYRSSNPSFIHNQYVGNWQLWHSYSFKKKRKLASSKAHTSKIPAGTVRVSKLGVPLFLWKTHMTSSNLFMNRIQPHETIIRLQGWGLMSIKFIAKVNDIQILHKGCR